MNQSTKNREKCMVGNCERIAIRIGYCGKHYQRLRKTGTTEKRTNPNIIDLVGDRYGRLVVIQSAAKTNDLLRWLCICDCGNKVVVVGAEMRRGNTKSCGCLKRDNNGRRTHGLSHVPEYPVWLDMKRRCNNTKVRSYKNYGARGIKVAERWSNFSTFYSDMGARPTSKHTIERVDNNGDYAPDNCIWDTRKVQMNNVRYNHILKLHGEEKTMMEWSEATGIKYSTLRSRVYILGWSDEKALTEPVNKR